MKVKFFRRFNARRMAFDWYWRAVSKGRNIAIGGQGYSRKIDARRGYLSFRSQATMAEIEEVIE